MIVRIMGEGQFRVSSALLDRLNEIDNNIVVELGKGKEERMRALLREMILLVRKEGKPLDPTELRASDVIIPPEDLKLEEAKRLFTGAGLIPD